MKSHRIFWPVYGALQIYSWILFTIGVCILCAPLLFTVLSWFFANDEVLKMIDVPVPGHGSVAGFFSRFLTPAAIMQSLLVGLIFTLQCLVFRKLGALLYSWLTERFLEEVTVARMQTLGYLLIANYVLTMINRMEFIDLSAMVQGLEKSIADRDNNFVNILIEALIPTFPGATSLLVAVLFFGAASYLSEYIKLKTETAKLREEAELTI